MPADRRAALVELVGGSASEAESDQIRAVVDLGLDGLVVDACAAGAPARLALARAANELAAEGEAGLALPESSFVTLLEMEAKGELSATQAKAVLSAAVGAARKRPPASWRGRWASRLWAPTRWPLSWPTWWRPTPTSGRVTSTATTSCGASSPGPS